jgi:hypothetical protein
MYSAAQCVKRNPNAMMSAAVNAASCSGDFASRHHRHREGSDHGRDLQHPLQPLQVGQAGGVVLAPVPERERRAPIELNLERPLVEHADIVQRITAEEQCPKGQQRRASERCCEPPQLAAWLNAGIASPQRYHDQRRKFRPGRQGHLCAATGRRVRRAARQDLEEPPEAWVGYNPDQLLSDVFDVPAAYTDVTLAEALELRGGGINALLRHAVAALLNAASPSVDYPLTTAQVIQMTNEAIASGNSQVIEETKDLFDLYNNLGAPGFCD